MSDGFFKRGKIWWFRTDPLTGKQASSGKRDIKSAELEYRERSRRATNPDYQPEASEDASLNHWALKFVEHKAAFKSAATAHFYEKKLGHVVRILGADTAISNALRPAAFDAYVRQRKAEGARSTTILKEIGAAKTLAKFAARAGAYHGRPELFRPTELSDDYEPGERFLSPSELVSLLAVLPPHRAAHVALAVAIGCRFSETFRVLPGDVDTGAWLVHIRGTKTKRARATVPVAEPFRALLEAALPYLPLRPWLNSNMKRDLAKACAKAGIAPVTSNDLRRTHGSWLAEAGVSDEHIGKVLRHADGRMARRVYGQLSPEKLGKLLEAKTSKESGQDEAPASPAKLVESALAGGRLGPQTSASGVTAGETAHFAATIPQQLTTTGESMPAETPVDSGTSEDETTGLKILVSAVQFRPGTQHNLAESEGKAGDSESRSVAQSDALSRNVRNENATAAEFAAARDAGWFGPEAPPAVEGDFAFLQGGWR